MGKQTWVRHIGAGLAVLLVMAVVPAYVAKADRFTSPSYTIDASVGNTFGGSTSGTSYKMTDSGGEAIIGNGSGGSYKLTTGYVAQLEKSLQLTVQPSGLLAYFPLDETIGTRVYDGSLQGYDAPFVGTPTRQAGKIGNGIVTSTGNYVKTEQNPAALSSATVCAWVYPTASSLSSIIARGDSTLSAGGMWSFGLDASLFPQIQSNVAGTVQTSKATSAISLNAWSHICFTESGSQPTFYINGAAAGSGGLATSFSTSGQPITVGARNGGAQPFGGTVDEVKIYSRALSTNEITAEYTAGAAGVPAGLAFASTLVPGTPQAVDAQALVQTDAPGYSLAVAQNQNLTSGGNTISAITNGGTITSPVAWANGTTKGLGFTLTAISAGTLDPKWGSGSNFAAVPSSSTGVYTRTGYTAGGKDTVNIRFKVDVPSAQAAGTYTNTVTYTGTMTP